MPKKTCSQAIPVVHKDANPSSIPVSDLEHIMVDVKSVEHGNKDLGTSPLHGNVTASNTSLCLNIDMVHNSLECLRNGMQVSLEIRAQNFTNTPNHNSPYSSTNDVFAFNATKGQLFDISNKLNTDSAMVSTRKLKKIEKGGNNDSEGVVMTEVEDRRPSLDSADMKNSKRKCVGKKSEGDKENDQVVARYQHHRYQ